MARLKDTYVEGDLFVEGNLFSSRLSTPAGKKIPYIATKSAATNYNTQSVVFSDDNGIVPAPITITSDSKNSNGVVLNTVDSNSKLTIPKGNEFIQTNPSTIKLNIQTGEWYFPDSKK